MRRLIIAANWKMNTTLADAMVLATVVRDGLESVSGVEIVLCPPSVFLYPVSEVIHSGISHISLGAQNIFDEDFGAYTGEISAPMIKKICRYAIIGHSERRDHFKETNSFISDKIEAAIRHKITPIICVGEHKKTMDSYKDAARELKESLAGIPKSELGNIIVSYEPIWAIGTGKPATPEYAAKAITLMREVVGPKTPILYGGSVDSKNIANFTRRAEIDGALVGGASLKGKEFVSICEQAAESKHFR